MGSLEKILYSPLMEEQVEDVTGWCKETVQYVQEHRTRVERQIRGIAKGLRKNGLQPADVEDIYGEVLMYLYQSDDYNLNKAITRSSTGNLVSLEGYINVCIKFCVKRFCTKLSANESEIADNTVVGEDNKELSIFDTIHDKSADISLDYLDCDLETICRGCEPARYRFGPDLYLILYVRLLTNNKPDKTFKEILEVLGIDKKDLARIDRTEDSAMLAFAKAISITDSDEALEMLEKYVYSSRLIKQAVMLHS